MELDQQFGLNPRACFIARPHLVTKGLYDVVGRDSYMSGAILNHFQYRCQHSPYGSNLDPFTIEHRRQGMIGHDSDETNHRSRR
jgi:hypothetical protein